MEQDQGAVLIAATDRISTATLLCAMEIGADVVFEIPLEEREIDATIADLFQRKGARGPVESVWIPAEAA